MDVGEPGCECGEKALHDDAVVMRVADSGMIRVELDTTWSNTDVRIRTGISYLDSSGGRNTVSEVAGVEVALQRSDGEDQTSTLDLFLNFGMRERTDVDLESQELRSACF